MRWPRRSSSLLVAAGMLLLAGTATVPARAEPAAVSLPGSVVGYRFVDLGLGGDSTAIAVNDRGDVVGSTAVPIAFLWSGGRVRLLGTLGGTWSAASAVNDRGQVVGRSGTRSGAAHAFLWTGGHMRDLGVVGTADAVNHHGVVVGTAFPRSGAPYAYRWSAGRLTSLTRYGIRAGPRTEVAAIDDAGRIIGTDADGPFLLTGNRLVRIGGGTAGGTVGGPVRMTEAVAFGADGAVVGTGRAADGSVAGVIRTSKGLSALEHGGVDPTSGGTGYGRVLGADGDGGVVGITSVSTRVDPAPCLWYRGTMTVLPTPSDSAGYAVDVNRHSLVIGYSLRNAPGSAAIWIPGQYAVATAVGGSPAARIAGQLPPRTTGGEV